MSVSDDEKRALHEAVLLATDVPLIVGTMMAPHPERPLHSPTPQHGNYFAVTGDLFRQCVEFCLHTGLLLQQGVFGSAAVLARSAYERALDLMYLITQGDKIHNALQFRARTLLEVVDLFSSQPSGLEAQQILARMPPDIVAEQKRRRRARLGWSGKSLEAMATTVGVDGHKHMYGLLSWYAHGRIAGYDVSEERDEGEDFRMRFAEASSAQDRQGLANMTRRLLHQLYRVLAKDWLGTIPPLATSNPEATRNW